MTETFPEREERILDFWQREHIFELSMKNREGAPYFSFYDGPPFATGLPHYGHLLAGTIKDVVPTIQDDERLLCAAPLWLGLPRPSRRK